MRFIFTPWIVLVILEFNLQFSLGGLGPQTKRIHKSLWFVFIFFCSLLIMSFFPLGNWLIRGEAGSKFRRLKGVAAEPAPARALQASSFYNLLPPVLPWIGQMLVNPQAYIQLLTRLWLAEPCMGQVLTAKLIWEAVCPKFCKVLLWMVYWQGFLSKLALVLLMFWGTCCNSSRKALRWETRSIKLLSRLTLKILSTCLLGQVEAKVVVLVVSICPGCSNRWCPSSLKCLEEGQCNRLPLAWTESQGNHFRQTLKESQRLTFIARGLVVGWKHLTIQIFRFV